ncbi:TK/DDR protein kinase [Loa loa]|uniref:TK/DDR protein kinase n=1 Tax=Loa loa TaxID=7209 RepID=A0A1S0UMS7_LOALO|nr:TK/DDR protein kinase [Loa loa]EJD76708.1 TK/DDR protein kinase [Loa loa]
MESGEIGDSQLSASTSFDIISVGPQNARIRKELASGAWCPKPQIKAGSYEFLEVNFEQVYVITGIETQGRYGNGTGREYTTHYMIEYLRLDSSWIKYQNRALAEVLDGNEDTATVVRRDLDPPIVASQIRIVPYSTYARTMCLRVEFYGCPYNDALMFYSMNNDGSRIDSYDFRDKIFEKSNMISHFTNNKKGLGLLTDGIIATTNPLDDITGSENKIPAAWIGWNQLITNGSVEIVFEFSEIRKFTYLEIWSYGTSLRMTEIFFSTNGKKFALASQISSIQRRPLDAMRNVPIRIPLHNATGQALKMKLSYKDQWLFLSEIHFASSTVKKATVSTRIPITITATTTVIITSSGPGIFNVTSSTTVEEPIGIFPVVYFIGLVILFLLITCVLCGILISRRHEPNPKNHNNGRAKIMVTSLGEKGFCTNFCDANDIDYHQVQNNGFYADEKKLATVNKRTKRSPSWSDFHFPPPPSDIYGINESTTMEPLLLPKIPVSPVVPIVRTSKVDQIRPKKINNGDSLHYATAAVRVSDFKVKRRIEKFNTNQAVLGSELGRGRFTVIRSCSIDSNNYAAKIIIDKNKQAMSIFNDEVKILSKIDHENLIKLYGIDDNSTMYLELALYGNVRQYLAHEPEANFLSMLQLVVEIAAGMKYLEQRQIVHGHLSPQCILIDQKKTVKITSPRGHLHHAQLRYSAPESVIANEWSNKSDVWSFAVTAWEVFNDCTMIPFAELTNAQLLENAKHIYSGLDAIYLELPMHLPQQVSNLIGECWRRIPSDRPTFLEIHYILSMKHSGVPIPEKGNAAILSSITI